jgi:hypothetical protein
MNAVAHRILGVPPAVTFPDEAVGRGLDIWSRPPVLPPSLAAFFAPPNGGVGTSASSSTPTAGWTKPLLAPAGGPAGGGTSAGGGGRRRALCVGIDRYPTAPLAGCVADAREWAQCFETLGFETALLLDDDATRSRILEDLRALVASGQPGDVIAFQFAGHGTELADLDGDEVAGTNGAKDEALCPYDLAQGAYLIDDDLAEVFAALPDGVNLTCFIDCCHSGTITRLMVGPAGDGDGRDRRPRFMPATAAMEAAHRQFRKRMGAMRAAPKRSQEAMRQVVFSACRDYEVAFETAGHGDFTVQTTRLLAGGLGGVTHEAFQARVNAAFGESARQHPELDCAPTSRTRLLLAPLAASSTTGAGGAAASNGHAATSGAGGRAHAAGIPSPTALAQALRTIADALAPAP